MRFFFAGPRILGIRPGIVFGPEDLRKSRRRSAQSATMTGSFVYVIEGQAGHHKIGVSRDPIQRLADLQTGSPVRLRFAYIGVTPGDGYNIEGRAHELLDAHRKEGEWFLVPGSIAIGAAIEAANRLGEPIQQVQPESVPQIIFLASQPEPGTSSPSRARLVQLWLLWILTGVFFCVVALSIIGAAHP